MKVLRVLGCVFAVVLLVIANWPGVCEAGESDVAFLVNRVTAIAAPGVPGPLSVFGEGAFPVIVVTSDGETREPVVAAAKVGRGRVVAFGHPGYLSAGAFDTGDTGRLVANGLRWAANTPKAAAAQLRVGTFRLDGAAQWLRDHNVHVDELQFLNAQSLKDCDILLAKASQLREPRQRDAVKAYLAGGGGLLTADLGWGWQQLNPGKDLITDHPGNRLLADVGIVWCDGYLKKSADGHFPVDGPPSRLTHAAEAIDAVVDQENGSSSLSDSEVRQAIAVTSRAVRSIPGSDSLLLPKLAALERTHAGSVVPSKKRPITWKTPLARLLLTLQLARLRSAPSEAVAAHPAAMVFPGPVEGHVARVRRRITIDTSVPRWHSTGLYAAPGEVVRVSFPEKATGKKLWVRIGAHNDRLWGKDRWNRCPEVCSRFPITDRETTVANAFGGLVYVEVPRNCNLERIEVEIDGAIESPYFVLDETDIESWRSEIRKRETPWAELAGKKIILTVPSSVVRKLDDPVELMRFWDRVADACAELACRPLERECPERYVVDVQISAGYMHSGYPIMTHNDVAATMVNLAKLMNQGHGGVWGFYHELGHNHQSRDWTFDGTSEVTVNLFTLYVLDRVCGRPPHEARDVLGSKRKAMLQKYREAGSSFDQWKRDPFLALIMYVQLQEAFGWEAFQKVFAEYRNLSDETRPKSDAEKRDQWLVRFSRTVGHNLGPFFEAWGVPTSAEARGSIEGLPDWSPAE